MYDRAPLTDDHLKLADVPATEETLRCEGASGVLPCASDKSTVFPHGPQPFLLRARAFSLRKHNLRIYMV